MTTGGTSPIALSPFTALNRAVAKVPQLKYAMAVMGVAAVVAIVLTWIADPRIAVFGIVITIALMYVLAIFAQAIGSLPGRLWLAAFLAWSVAILFVAVLVMLITSYAWGKPETLSNRLFLSTPSASSSPTPELPSLSGMVVDQSENPVQGAKVTIDEIPGLQHVDTSSEGVFRFNEVPRKFGEMVRIRIVKDGYEPNPYTQDVVLGKVPPRVKLTRRR
jgi:hypothetical protein